MVLPDILILAGGKAKRLGKLCINKPKSLIDFNGNPFIFYQLKLLKKKKFNKVIICTGHLSNQIKQYLNSTKYNFDLKIIFSNDGKSSLGTGGAIKKALPLLSKNFFLIFGDSYLDINYSKVYKKFLESKRPALMTIYRNNNQKDLTREGLSDVELINKNIIKYDKKNRNSRMKYINYGVSVFNKNAFKDLSLKRKFDAELIYQKLILKEKLLSYKIKNKIYEVGSIKGINLTKKLFNKIYK